VADHDSGSKPSAGSHNDTLWRLAWDIMVLFAVLSFPFGSTTWLNRFTWFSLFLGIAFGGLHYGWRLPRGQTTILVLATLCFSASMILGVCSLIAGDGGGWQAMAPVAWACWGGYSSWRWIKWQARRVKAQPPSELPGPMEATPTGPTHAEPGATAARPRE
jgi:hypothetical protein